MNRLLRWCTPPLLALLAVSVAGCGGLLGPPPQRQLYRVTAVDNFSGLRHIDKQLIVGSIAAPAGLDTRRIALSRSPISVNYYAGVEWTDRLPVLVRTALVESLENSHAFAAVSDDPLSLHGDYRLDTELRDFEAVYDSPAKPPEIKVAMMLKLIRLSDDSIVAQTLISTGEPTAANGIPQILPAFDTAFRRALRQGVTWAASNAALPPPRR